MTGAMGVIEEVSQQELTAMDWLSLAWALTWRALIMMVVAMVAGAILGGILGFCLGIGAAFLKIDINNYRTLLFLVGAVVGLVPGFLAQMVVIKWLLAADFGSFRVALVRPQAGATPI